MYILCLQNFNLQKKSKNKSGFASLQWRFTYLPLLYITIGYWNIWSINLINQQIKINKSPQNCLALTLINVAHINARKKETYFMCVFFSQEFSVHHWILAVHDYLQVSLFCWYLCVGITCTFSRLANCCLYNSSFFGGNRGICRSKLPKKIAAVVLV